MADEDNFDIDIYGDDTNPDYQQDEQEGDEVKQEEPVNDVMDETGHDEAHQSNSTVKQEEQPPSKPDGEERKDNVNGLHDQTQQIISTGGSAVDSLQPPKQAPIQQGTKRNADSDDRPKDPGATRALLISDLHWWTNEDDVRGWANQSACEDELEDVTFNEHKVNGKSKG